jgi:hypothetical protein
MAETEPRYTIGLFRWKDRVTSSKTDLSQTLPDGTHPKTVTKVSNYRIREVTSTWGPFTFSKPTDFSLKVGELSWRGRPVEVVKAGTNEVPSNYVYEYDITLGRQGWVAHPDAHTRGNYGLGWRILGTPLMLPFLGFKIGLPFTERAAARNTVRELVTIAETTKGGGSRRRPALPPF